MAQTVTYQLFLCSNLEYASHYLCQQYKTMFLPHGIVDKDNEIQLYLVKVRAQEQPTYHGPRLLAD